jgi:transcriptional regulator with XRE-family HTH domain
MNITKISLREWRKEQRYSQEYLADLLSKKLNEPVTQDYISRLENGQHPRYDIGIILQKMAKNKLSFGSAV